MSRLILTVPLLFVLAGFAGGQVWLSPVNTGDCVAPRIGARRTSFVDELDKKRCAENNPDGAKARRCVENSRAGGEIYFFTDRCSEDEYFIGVNGEEVRLRRTGRARARPHHFVGTFAGGGLSVRVSRPRLIRKTYLPGEPRNEANVLDAAYRVLVTVRKGRVEKSFDGTLLYGR